MDHIGDNSLIPDSPFSFQRLLCGDDWHRWDTYPTVDANAISPDPTVERNRDDQTIESDSLLVTLSLEETVEQNWLQSSTSEQSETASQEDYIGVSSDEDTFTYEELLNITEDIGDVCTGLNFEVIDANLRRRKYENCSDETEKCVICLYKLKYSEEVSKLGCGHDFHFGCIKNWLMVKNRCPLCKQKAL